MCHMEKVSLLQNQAQAVSTGYVRVPRAGNQDFVQGYEFIQK